MIRRPVPIPAQKAKGPKIKMDSQIHHRCHFGSRQYFSRAIRRDSGVEHSNAIFVVPLLSFLVDTGRLFDQPSGQGERSTERLQVKWSSWMHLGWIDGYRSVYGVDEKGVLLGAAVTIQSNGGR